jgi:hypothetical protein
VTNVFGAFVFKSMFSESFVAMTTHVLRLRCRKCILDMARGCVLVCAVQAAVLGLATGPGVP